ncbi:hypothetical protein HY837_06310 [archaeon]|nr:hypothetical protein [archaeon]
MTIHCVVSFFEKEDCGYLLGSDSCIGRVAKDKVVDHFLAEKAFFSENSIGVIGGAFSINSAKDVEKSFYSKMRSLDGVFEDVDEVKDYSHIPMLESAQKYRLFVAKRNQDGLKLYRVSSVGENQNKARIIHSFDKESYESSKIWYSILSNSYFVINNKDRFNLEQAIDVANSALNPQIDDYDPGPSHLYIVSFNKTERLPIK